MPNVYEVNTDEVVGASFTPNAVIAGYSAEAPVKRKRRCQIQVVWIQFTEAIRGYSTSIKGNNPKCTEAITVKERITRVEVRSAPLHGIFPIHL